MHEHPDLFPPFDRSFLRSQKAVAELQHPLPLHHYDAVHGASCAYGGGGQPEEPG